jgi:hypothetical protein
MGGTDLIFFLFSLVFISVPAFLVGALIGLAVALRVSKKWGALAGAIGCWLGTFSAIFWRDGGWALIAGGLVGALLGSLAAVWSITSLRRGRVVFEVRMSLHRSLGIVSLVLGILAFIASFIPWAGCYQLGELGLLTGFVSLVIALVKKGNGIGFPIVGTALSLLALVGIFSPVSRPRGDPPEGDPPRGDMNLWEFMYQRPSGATAVEVYCKLGPNYGGAFIKCAETHYSFTIARRWPGPILYATAYAPKDSKHGRKLYEMLKDGSGRDIMLLLQRLGPDGKPFPPGDFRDFAVVGIAEEQGDERPAAKPPVKPPDEQVPP